MSRKRTPKPGSLGVAFHSWLEYLEYVEAVVVTGKTRGKQKYIAMNDKLFTVADDAAFRRMMQDTVPVDAYLARVVRSSVKYKVEAHTLIAMVRRYAREMDYIAENYPVNLPFEWSTLVIEGVGPDDIIVSLMETESDDRDYTELGVKKGEKFISCSIAFYRHSGLEMNDGQVSQSQRLSHCPVEIHFPKGCMESEGPFLNAVAKGVTVSQRGVETIDLVRHCVTAWLRSFHLSSILRRRQPGVIEGAPGKGHTRRKLRKKRQHPHFEHIIVELPVDEPDPEQCGRTVWQPRKRLHQVRGFFRHYKSGRTVWVKPHWRGDEQIGVVKKDYEVTLHEKDNEEGDDRHTDH